jgi:ParB/RepB/Spo0J family partition protein
VSDAAPRVELRAIPIELIDPPEIAMRETMDDEGMSGLVESLQRHGQLQNVGLVVAGDRYRVVYGHRRRVAAGLAGLSHLIARVFPEGTPDEEALKVDENEEQEPVNAAAQATYYLELLEKRCGGDVDKLIRMVRRKESFVLDRLDLTRGDPEVLEALRRSELTIGVARELNKVSEPMYRRLFLHDAIAQGLSVKAIRTLRQNRDRDRHVTDAQNDGTAPTVEQSTATALVSMDACAFCASVRDQHDMTYAKVHRSCLAVWIRDLADKPTSSGDRG